MEECIQQSGLNEKSERATSTSAAVTTSDYSMTRNSELPGPSERRKRRNELLRLQRRERAKAKRKGLVNAAGIGAGPQKKRKRGLNQEEMKERVKGFEASSPISGFRVGYLVIMLELSGILSYYFNLPPCLVWAPHCMDTAYR